MPTALLATLSTTTGFQTTSATRTSDTVFTLDQALAPAIRLRITPHMATARTGVLCRTRATLWATLALSTRQGAISPATIISAQLARQLVLGQQLAHR